MMVFDLLGCKKYKVSKDSASDIVNVCSIFSVPCVRHEFYDDTFSFSIPFFECTKFERILCSVGIECECVEALGVIPRLLLYKNRIGLLIGFLICICVLTSSPSFLWNIEIVGNEKIKDEEMVETLKRSGLFLGCYLPHTNTDKIESAALVDNNKLSWISVNISGNTAYVEVRERIDINSETRELPYANIVAAEDGIVTDMEIFSGMSVIRKNTYVRKGELLISGVITKEALGTYLTYARGHIYGKNFNETMIEVPFAYEKLEETGKKKYSIELNIFSDTYSLFSACAPFQNFNEYIDSFFISEGNRKLPFSVVRTVYCEKDYVSAERSAEEAKKEAFLQLEELFLTEYADAEILSKDIEITVTGESVILKCGFWYEREIGVTVEFEAIE